MFVITIVGKRGIAVLRTLHNVVVNTRKKDQSTTISYDVECFDIVPCRRESAEAEYVHRNRNHCLIEDNPSSG
jgi:hypothetical protein